MPEHLSDEELEQALRDGLRRRAEGAPSRLREALPGPSGERSGGRRRTVWLAGAAAAVVAVGVPLALQRGSGWVSTQPPPTPTTASTGPAGPGGGWRSESYAGVELSVPSTWGWGGTPVNPGHGDPDGVCEVRGATAAPDGSVDRNAGMRLPFVGRPILQSDACRLTDRAAVHPDVDAVWFDSPRPVGTSRDAVTLEVGGRRISVFTANAELRNRIVKSVRAVATDRGGCPSAFGSEDPGDPVGTAPALVVCAYARAGGRTTLLFGTRRGAAAANAYEKALSAAPRTPPVPCPQEQVAELVRVGRSVGGRVAWDTVELGACARILPSEGRQVALTRAVTSPWCGPEAKAYLVGPVPAALEPSESLVGLFRGVLG